MTNLLRRTNRHRRVMAAVWGVNAALALALLWFVLR